MRRLALPIAFLLAPAALAQAPAPAPAPQPPRVIPGVSAAGMAIIEKYRGKGDPELPGLARAQRDARQKLVAATLAAKIEPDRIADLLRDEEAARAALRTHQNDQMTAALRELPEADRAPFLRSLVRPAPTAAAPAR